VDYETRIAVISNERMELESLFLHEEELLRMQSESAQCDWVQKCWEKAINVCNMNKENKIEKEICYIYENKLNHFRQKRDGYKKYRHCQ
jgi:hypothetical protein